MVYRVKHFMSAKIHTIYLESARDTNVTVGREIMIPWSTKIPFAIVKVVGHGRYEAHVLVQFIRPA